MKEIKSKLSLASLFWLISVRPAFAHGEEVLVTIGAQLLLVAIFFVILAKKQIRKNQKLKLLVVFSLSVVFSWLLIAKLPYLANKEIITAAVLIIPSIGWVLGEKIIRETKK